MLDGLDAPLLTCEAVVSEAWFLIRRGGGNPVLLLELLEILNAKVVPAWGPRTQRFLERYPERSSIADASLLALAEAEPDRVVVTIDREDFQVNRIHSRRGVPALMPPA